MDNDRLRVGLLLESLDQPRWVYRLVEDIRQSSRTCLSLIVLNDTPCVREPPRLARVLRGWRTFLYDFYTLLDSWYFRKIPDPLDHVDLSLLLEDIPSIRMVTGMTRRDNDFETDDLARIRAYDLDVVVSLGLDPEAVAPNIARYGVWFYYHGDPRVVRGGPPGFWEFVEDQPATGTVLQVSSEREDGARVIYDSWSRTDRLSFRKNRSRFYWKSATFARRKLDELAELGPACLTDCTDGMAMPYDRRLYRTPGNREMVSIILRVAGRHARQQVSRRASLRQWFVAYELRSPGYNPDVFTDGELCNFKLLMPPKDRLWADPFPVVRDGRYYIFLEELLYRERKGRIVVVALDDDGNPGEMTTVLERDYHLSFPNVFEWGGELYMVPEAAEGGSVELYRCLSFPNHWVHEANLLEGIPAADPMIGRIGEHWWLFVTLPAAGTDCWDGELYLFHGPTPLGPWVPHRRNPVKSDVRNARSAGRLVMQGGRVFRPAQDCSGLYGSAIVINEITRLNEREFKERTVSLLRPRWRRGLLGTHTLNTTGRLTVVDGFHFRRRLA